MICLSYSPSSIFSIMKSTVTTSIVTCYVFHIPVIKRFHENHPLNAPSASHVKQIALQFLILTATAASAIPLGP